MMLNDIAKRVVWAGPKQLGAATSMALMAFGPEGGAAVPPISLTVGTPDFPDLATAVAAVPRLRQQGRDIEILLPAGVYRMKTPVVIDAPHGGDSGSRLFIRGAGITRSRLLGSMILRTQPTTSQDSGGRPVPTGANSVRLPGVLSSTNLVRRGAYVQSASAKLLLFQGAERLQPARWPAQGWAEGTVSGPRAALQLKLSMKETSTWEHEPALWAAGYWSADWAYERLPVVNIGKDGVKLAPLETPLPTRTRARFRIENALTEVRHAGDFAVDPIRHVAILIPRDGEQIVEAAVAPSLLQIEGAQNITISGIAFDRTLGTAVKVVDGQDIRFIQCAFRQTGASGVSVLGGKRVHIEGSIVADTAERGVLLSGGDRATLTAAGHVFADGVIADFGQESPSYRPAVELWGVGNAVRRSLLTGGDHNAVMLSGNDHEVTDNEISDVMRDTEDAGAIYMGADWAARGMVIARNLIRLGRRNATQFLIGIYLDDQASGARVEGNRIEGGDYGVVIGGGRDNLVQDNVITAPRRGGVYFDARGIAAQHGRVPEFAAALKRLPIGNATWRARYPLLAALKPADFGYPEGNRVSGNVVNDAPAIAGDTDAIARFLLVEAAPSKAAQFQSTLRVPALIKLLALRRPHQMTEAAAP